MLARDLTTTDLERSSVAEQTRFLTMTFDETVLLMHRARDVLGRIDREGGFAPSHRAAFVGEAARIRLRLVTALDWLLAQRAVAAGKVASADMLRRVATLAEIQDCLDEGEANAPWMPDDMRNLSRRSHALYRRLARMDEGIRKAAA